MFTVRIAQRELAKLYRRNSIARISKSLRRNIIARNQQKFTVGIAQRESAEIGMFEISILVVTLLKLFSCKVKMRTIYLNPERFICVCFYIPFIVAYAVFPTHDQAQAQFQNQRNIKCISCCGKKLQLRVTAAHFSTTAAAV